MKKSLIKKKTVYSESYDSEYKHPVLVKELPTEGGFDFTLIQVDDDNQWDYQTNDIKADDG